MGLGLTNFTLEGVFQVEHHEKLKGRGIVKWLCCLPILHSKCNCWRLCHTWPSSKNKHASIHCPARLHLLSPFHYTMNCYELLLLLLYDALLWVAPAAAIWWIAMSCCCCMMSCYELLLLLYDAFRWCCLDHRISINNCSSSKCGSCILRLN